MIYVQGIKRPFRILVKERDSAPTEPPLLD